MFTELPCAMAGLLARLTCRRRLFGNLHEVASCQLLKRMHRHRLRSAASIDSGGNLLRNMTLATDRLRPRDRGRSTLMRPSFAARPGLAAGL